MAVLSILFLLLFVAHRISAQDPICSPSFGENIMYQDCQSAISASYVLASPILDTFPQHWSRDSAVLGGKMYHMPQAHTWKTCAIGIDLVDAPDNIHGKLTPRALKDIVEHMLRTCVRRHGQGGLFRFRGIEIVVVHPLAGLGDGTCLGYPSPGRPLSTSLGAIIYERAVAKSVPYEPLPPGLFPQAPPPQAPPPPVPPPQGPLPQGLRPPLGGAHGHPPQ